MTGKPSDVEPCTNPPICLTESVVTLGDREFLCGVVEGFYGRPWTTEQRKDLFTKMQVGA